MGCPTILNWLQSMASKAHNIWLWEEYLYFGYNLQLNKLMCDMCHIFFSQHVS